MFCQCMTRCYAQEQDPGMAPRCQSLVTYVHSSSVLLAMPGMTLVRLGIHSLRLFGEPAPDLRFTCRASITPPAQVPETEIPIRRSTSPNEDRRARFRVLALPSPPESLKPVG